MNVHIYDTHVTTHTGQYLHFDILVDDINVPHVARFAEAYLRSLGIMNGQISQSRCHFCHSEIANPEVQLAIQKQGHSILVLA